MGKKNKQAYQENVSAYTTILNRLKELYMNMFEWINVPDTIDVRYLEYTLLHKGWILYFNDDIIGNLALPCNIGGVLNPYNIPIYREAYSNNGYRARRTIKDSVIIYDNYMHTYPVSVLRYYAKRISDIQRTIDINVHAQKTPVAITTSDETRFSIENLYANYAGNTPVIIAKDSLNLDDIKVIKTDAPFVSDRLYDLKQQYWNEALTFCGIAPVNNKRERVLTDEISASFVSIAAQRSVMLNSRQQAVEKINKMFGTDISVEFNKEILYDSGEVNSNEQIYDNSQAID